MILLLIALELISPFGIHELCELLYHETKILIIIRIFFLFLLLAFDNLNFECNILLSSLIFFIIQSSSSSSCSLSFPNRAAIVIVARFCDSVIAVTFGCQVLFKDLRIFMLSSSISKVLPSPLRWLIMCVNRFFTS